MSVLSRWCAGVLTVGAALLAAACTVSVGDGTEDDWTSSAVGENSDFSRLGKGRIEQEKAAVIDFRKPLTTSDLGGTPDNPAVGFSLDPDESPVRVTIRLPKGDLVIPAEVVHIGANGETVVDVAIFQGAPDSETHLKNFAVVAASVGMPQPEIDEYIAGVRAHPTLEWESWFGPYDALGTEVEMRPSPSQDAVRQVLEVDVRVPGGRPAS